MLTQSQSDDIRNIVFEGFAPVKQRKISGLPAISHSVKVAEKAIVFFEDESTSQEEKLFVRTVAFAHDILEDCEPVFFCRIANISPIVGEIVLELSKTNSQTKSEFYQSFQDKSLLSMLLKLIDISDNLDDFRLTDIRDGTSLEKRYRQNAEIFFSVFESRLTQLNILPPNIRMGFTRLLQHCKNN